MAQKKKSLGHQADVTISKRRVRLDVEQSLFFRRKTDLPWRRSLETPDPGGTLFARRSTDIEKFKNLEDSELIKIIYETNSEALYQELFQRYQRKLFVYILHLVGSKEEAEDIMQNVFAKTHKNINHFDITRKFSSWIYRIAHNEAVNYLKRRNKKYFISWEDVSSSKDKIDLSSNEMPLEEVWMHEEATKEVKDALEQLPAKYREILEMRYFSEYSYEKIGKILGKPINTVGTLINRSKKKLLEVVQKNR